MPFELWNTWRDSNINWWNAAENNGKEMVLFADGWENDFWGWIPCTGVSIKLRCAPFSKKRKKKKAKTERGANCTLRDKIISTANQTGYQYKNLDQSTASSVLEHRVNEIRGPEVRLRKGERIPRWFFFLVERSVSKQRILWRATTRSM